MSGLAGLALPPSIVLLGAWLLSFIYGYSIPTWLTTLCALSSLPVAFSIRVRYATFKNRRDATALGAVLPYRLQGRWLGNIDFMRATFVSYASGYPGEIYLKLAETVGPCFDNYWLYESFLFTSEPEHVKSILSTSFQSWEKGALLRAQFHSVLGSGVFNSDGDMWKFHRTMTRPFFTRDRISHFDIFDRHAETAILLMKTRFKSGLPVDFQDLISRFTLDSATEFLFDHSVDSLAVTLPYPHNASCIEKPVHNQATEFAQAFLQAQKVISERTMLGSVWGLFELFKDRSKQPMKVVDAYINPILDEALRKHNIAKNLPEYPAENNADVDDSSTLLDDLIKSTTDRQILHDEIFNILVAGRDTTAALITFIVYCLATHPNVLTRLREEIINHVGPTQRPTFEDIKDMKYLRAVINETLRLFPPVPFNIRCSVEPVILPSSNPSQKPLYFPAGTPSIYSVLVMHRRKDLWGPDAEEFDPDRFLDERLKKYLLANPFIFLPFNAGPRICLGQQFAYNEVSFFLIRLLQNVDGISLNLAAQPPESRALPTWALDGPGRAKIEQVFPKLHLTMYVYEGLWVNMNVVE